MRIDRLAQRILFFALAVMAGSGSLAFEPGTKRICKPSADGQSFECVDPTGVKDGPAPAKNPVEEPVAPLPAQAAAAPTPAEVSAPASPSDSPKPASELPNYLRQGSNAGFSAPARTPAPKPATETKPISAKDPVAVAKPIPASAPVAAVKPVPAPAPVAAVIAEPTPTPAPAASAAESAQPAPAPARVLDPAPVAATQPVDKEPAPAKGVPAAVSPGTDQQTTETSSSPAKPSPPAAKPVRPTAPIPGPAKTSPRSLPGASEFRQLPGEHYTLELSSVRNVAALNPLIDSLDGFSGQLYLLRLNMPDGIWHSLCWSDFSSLESARDARKTLPADAAITAGWPRRISLLQGEIAP